MFILSGIHTATLVSYAIWLPFTVNLSDFIIKVGFLLTAYGWILLFFSILAIPA